MTEVARRRGVARHTVHSWLRRYADEGLGGLADRPSRPASCPHQMPAVVEARIVGIRREHPGWEPSRIRWEPGACGWYRSARGRDRCVRRDAELAQLVALCGEVLGVGRAAGSSRAGLHGRAESVPSQMPGGAALWSAWPSGFRWRHSDARPTPSDLAIAETTP